METDMTETMPPGRLDLASMDVAADRVARLREDFPEVFREGQIDFDALKRSLGGWVAPEKERFGLTWPGKANGMRVIQQPSVATLVPERAESVDFDTTQNVIVEGENLEVLKLLQKSYYGKVKMIYIDPPYNTGNEFIYSDDFREPLDRYLRLTGQTNEDGARLSTNTDNRRALPLELAEHDVPAPLSGAESSARRRRDFRQHRRSRGAEPAPTHERNLWGRELSRNNHLAKGVLSKE
jgi:hypothetical protein